jgi:hypothetical protein
MNRLYNNRFVRNLLFSGNGLFGLIDPIWSNVDDNATPDPWPVDPPNHTPPLTDAEKYAEVRGIVQRASVLKRLDAGLSAQCGNTFFTNAIDNAMRLMWNVIETNILLENNVMDNNK